MRHELFQAYMLQSIIGHAHIFLIALFLNFLAPFDLAQEAVRLSPCCDKILAAL